VVLLLSGCGCVVLFPNCGAAVVWLWLCCPFSSLWYCSCLVVAVLSFFLIVVLQLSGCGCAVIL
jgi:hypothetical protein